MHKKLSKTVPGAPTERSAGPAPAATSTAPGRPIRRLAATAGAAALVVGLVAPPSQAAPSQAARVVVSTEQVPVDLFYDDVVTGTGANTLILYTGTSLAGHCAEEYPTATSRIRAKGQPPAAGARLVEHYVARATFYVYEGGGLDAVEFLGAVCGAELPSPVATGRGIVKRKIVSRFLGSAQPPHVTDSNGAVGVVRTTDGQRWSVRGEAELTFSPAFSVDHVSFTVRNR